MARLILRRQLRDPIPEADRPLTFKDLKVGEVFRRVVGPDKVAMICTKTSNRKARHRLGETAFDDRTLVHRCTYPTTNPAGLLTFQRLSVGDIFRFVDTADNVLAGEYMKLSASDAVEECEPEGATVEEIPVNEPVIFVRHTLD